MTQSSVIAACKKDYCLALVWSGLLDQGHNLRFMTCPRSVQICDVDTGRSELSPFTIVNTVFVPYGIEGKSPPVASFAIYFNHARLEVACCPETCG
jgi:hypothetical protein